MADTMSATVDTDCTDNLEIVPHCQGRMLLSKQCPASLHLIPMLILRKVFQCTNWE